MATSQRPVVMDKLSSSVAGLGGGAARMYHT